MKPTKSAIEPEEEQPTAWETTVTNSKLIRRTMVSESFQPEEQSDTLKQVEMTAKNYCPIGLSKVQPGDLPVATRLNTSGTNGMVVARDTNFTEQPRELSAGSTIGTLTRVKTDQVDDCLLEAESNEG